MVDLRARWADLRQRQPVQTWWEDLRLADPEGPVRADGHLCDVIAVTSAEAAALVAPRL